MKALRFLTQFEILRQVLLFILPVTLVGTQTAWAAIPYDYSGKTLSDDLVNTYKLFKEIDKKYNWNALVSEDLRSMDGAQAASAIADRGFNQWLQSEEVSRSAVGSTAKSIDKAMKQEVLLDNSGGVQHKLNLQLLAFQAQARINYEGFTNASVYYTARDSALGVEVFQKVSQTRDLVVSHLVRPDNRLSQVGMRFSW